MESADGNPLALPLAGGKFISDDDNYVSVAANPEVCRNSLRAGSKQLLPHECFRDRLEDINSTYSADADESNDSFVGVLLDFLEHQNRCLRLLRDEWSMLGRSATKYVGDLARIQQSFVNPSRPDGSPPPPPLKTNTPGNVT